MFLPPSPFSSLYTWGRVDSENTDTREHTLKQIVGCNHCNVGGLADLSWHTVCFAWGDSIFQCDHLLGQISFFLWEHFYARRLSALSLLPLPSFLFPGELKISYCKRSISVVIPVPAGRGQCAPRMMMSTAEPNQGPGLDQGCCLLAREGSFIWLAVIKRAICRMYLCHQAITFIFFFVKCKNCTCVDSTSPRWDV